MQRVIEDRRNKCIEETDMDLWRLLFHYNFSYVIRIMPSLYFHRHYPIHLEAVGLRKWPWDLKSEKADQLYVAELWQQSENLSSLISVTIMLDLMQNFQYQHFQLILKLSNTAHVLLPELNTRESLRITFWYKTIQAWAENLFELNRMHKNLKKFKKQSAMKCSIVFIM